MKINLPLSLGLDLGSHSAKAVMLDCGGKEPILKGFKKFLVSKEGHFLPRTQVVSLLQEQLGKWWEAAGKFSVGIWGKDVMVRFLEMPKMNQEELKNSLQYEAEHHLPFKLTEAFFDTQILQEFPEPKKKMWVVLVAVKKGVVEDTLNLLKEAGMLPTCLDVCAIGLINSFVTFAKQEETRKVVFLVEVGRHITTLNIVAAGVPYLSREIELGTEQMLQALKKEGKESFKNTQTLKYREIHEVETFLKEIETSFDYFEASFNETVEKIFLAGEGVSLNGFQEFLVSHFNRPGEVFSPAPQLKKELFSGDTEEFGKSSHEYASALGLALRGARP